MKYSEFESIEATHWDRDYPHYISIRVSFKSKNERQQFLRKIKEILEK